MNEEIKNNPFDIFDDNQNEEKVKSTPIEFDTNKKEDSAENYSVDNIPVTERIAKEIGTTRLFFSTNDAAAHNGENPPLINMVEYIFAPGKYTVVLNEHFEIIRDWINNNSNFSFDVNENDKFGKLEVEKK